MQVSGSSPSAGAQSAQVLQQSQQIQAQAAEQTIQMSVAIEDARNKEMLLSSGLVDIYV